MSMVYRMPNDKEVDCAGYQANPLVHSCSGDRLFSDCSGCLFHACINCERILLIFGRYP